MQPIYIVTGPPAVGKSSFCVALMRRYPFGLHIPVDDLREMVVSGIAHPVGWTDETTRQFDLAAHAAADLAVRYQDAGFAVALDHCHSPPQLAALAEARFTGRPVVRIALVSSLETNLQRNATRTNKDFDAAILIPTIERLNPMYRTYDLTSEGWVVLPNDGPSVEEAVDRLLAQLESRV